MSDSAIRESLPEDLRYVDDSQPGISRKNVNGNVRYYDANGERITDDDQIKRLDALAVPPSYTDVWLCANPNGHLQATGRDSNGKKQYLYHARWREVRDATKYANLAAFGKALPALRKQLNQHIAQQQLSREKVLATVVKLLDTTLIRVGNNEYARRNKSYGVTTLRTRHVEITGNKLQFEFRGKSGVEHQISIKDRRLARVVKRCQDLPGQALFQYLDENKNRHSIDSSDVNAYLHKLCQADFTAKDFRTWAATVMALAALRKQEWQSESDAKSKVAQVVKDVASHLGNSPAVCRKCYIHPAVPEHFSSGKLAELPEPQTRKGLTTEEAALLTFLKQLS